MRNDKLIYGCLALILLFFLTTKCISDDLKHIEIQLLKLGMTENNSERKEIFKELKNYDKNEEIVALFYKVFLKGNIQQQIYLIYIILEFDPIFLAENIEIVWKAHLKEKISSQHQAKQYSDLVHAIVTVITSSDITDNKKINIIPFVVDFYKDYIIRYKDYGKFYKKTKQEKMYISQLSNIEFDIIRFFNFTHIEIGHIEDNVLRKMQDFFVFIFENSEQLRTKKLCLELLGRFGREQYVAYLEKLLDDSDNEISKAANKGLRWLTGRDYSKEGEQENITPQIHRLVDLIQNGLPNEKCGALFDLSRIYKLGSMHLLYLRKITPALLDIYSDESIPDDSRKKALQIIRKTKDKKATDLLLQILQNTKDDNEKIDILNTLRNIRDNRSKDMLLQIINDRSVLLIIREKAYSVLDDLISSQELKELGISTIKNEISGSRKSIQEFLNFILFICLFITLLKSKSCVYPIPHKIKFPLISLIFLVGVSSLHSCILFYLKKDIFFLKQEVVLSSFILIVIIFVVLRITNRNSQKQVYLKTRNIMFLLITAIVVFIYSAVLQTNICNENFFRIYMFVVLSIALFTIPAMRAFRYYQYQHKFIYLCSIFIVSYILIQLSILPTDDYEMWFGFLPIVFLIITMLSVCSIQLDRVFKILSLVMPFFVLFCVFLFYFVVGFFMKQ